MSKNMDMNLENIKSMKFILDQNLNKLKFYLDCKFFVILDKNVIQRLNSNLKL